MAAETFDMPVQNEVKLILNLLEAPNFHYVNETGGVIGTIKIGENHQFKVRATSYERAWTIDRLMRNDLTDEQIRNAMRAVLFVEV